MARRLYAVAVLLAALLPPLLYAGHAAAETAPGSNLTEEIRLLIAAVADSGINASLLSDALHGLTDCYQGPVADAARAALEALNEPPLLAQRLRELADLAAKVESPLLTCPKAAAAHYLYTVVLASFYTPTGLGVLIPPGGEASATLPPRLGGAACSPRGYAAVIAAASAGWLDDRIAMEVLNETGGAACLVIAAGLAGPPPTLAPEGGTAVSADTALEIITAYYVASGAAPPSPPWVFEDAVELLAADKRLEAAGLLHLLEAAYPAYSAALATVAASSDPLLHYAEKRAQATPRPRLPSSSPYCLAEQLLAESLVSREAGPETGVAEMLGAAASMCYAATGRGVLEMLEVNPLAPLDPAAASLGPGGPVRPLAEASAELPRSLSVPVTPEEAAHVLKSSRLPGSNINEIVRMAVEVKPLLELLAQWRGDPVLLGYAARAAGLRTGPGGEAYIDYAVARLVAWALVREGRIHFPNLVINDLQSPVEPYYVIFTVPGRQRLILWALGWITTTDPPSAEPRSSNGAEATAPEGQAPEPAAGRETAAPPMQPVAPSVETLEELADTLAAIPGGEAYAEILREAADAIRSGDYARAAEAARRLRSILENIAGEEAAQRLIEEAARNLGMDPEELARLLAETASLRPTGSGVTVDLREATLLAQRLAEAAATPEPGAETDTTATAAAQLLEAATGVIAESTRRALEQGEAPQPLRLEGLEWLLENTGPAGLFANITSLVAGLTAGLAAGEGGGTAATAASPGGVVVQPPPAPAYAAPRWLRLAAATAAAVAATLAAARSGALRRAAAAARLAAAERRLRPPTTSGGSGGEAAEAFAALLDAFARVHRPRRPSETHREYGRRLEGSLARVYWAAAAAYEKLRFGHGGAEELEALRRALREARRVLTGRGRR